jgi:hypothetical protein
MDKPVSEMNKQELRDYAKGLGVALDMRKPVEVLQEQVSKIAEKTAPTPKPELAKKPKATHLKNPVTGFWWPYHKLLADRGDLIPCDENGNAAK